MQKYLLGFTILSAIVILVGGIFLVSKNQPSQLESTGNAKLEILEASSYNWGEIDINGGIVEHTFTIKNSGESDLKLNNFITSCMCTEVQLSINGEESPRFGMHTNSRWIGAIAPGETANVTVYFDPLFHGPDGTGVITRVISFNTNDSSTPQAELRVSGVVFDGEDLR